MCCFAVEPKLIHASYGIVVRPGALCLGRFERVSRISSDNISSNIVRNVLSGIFGRGLYVSVHLLFNVKGLESRIFLK